MWAVPMICSWSCLLSTCSEELLCFLPLIIIVSFGFVNSVNHVFRGRKSLLRGSEMAGVSTYNHGLGRAPRKAVPLDRLSVTTTGGRERLSGNRPKMAFVRILYGYLKEMGLFKNTDILQKSVIWGVWLGPQDMDKKGRAKMKATSPFQQWRLHPKLCPGYWGKSLGGLPQRPSGRNSYLTKHLGLGYFATFRERLSIIKSIFFLW